jgi:hypothetical protein
MIYEKFLLAGVEYPLGHLNSFKVLVPAKDPLAAAATLLVTFSHHVFSEKWDEQAHTPDHKFEADGERRAFCPVRYGCSINLRHMIEYHVGGKAYKSRDGNGFWNHLFYDHADGSPYPIFFNLGRADRIEGVDGILRIKSAHQKHNFLARNRLETIKFARLVHQTCPPKI